MEIVLYFLPFLISIVLLIFFKKHIVWWEYIVLIVPSVLFTLVVREAFIWGKTEDTEYWGGYAVKIRHYDEWDEWIDRTCTRMVAVGTDEDGNTIYEEEEYDCSYRQYHSEYWVYENNITHHEVPINKELFEKIRKQFNTKMVFVDMHRNYYRIDGDAQDYFWNGKRETIYTITIPNSYRNKVKASNSIFNFEKISKKEAKQLGLFEYPNIIELDQNPILNKTNVYFTKNEIDAVKYVNGFYGGKKQFRTYILLFNQSDGIEKANKQQSYWQGGNKNELVVCFGIKPDKTVDWCYAFSWEDSQKMAIKTMEQYRNNEKLQLEEFSEWLINNLNNWKRKEFADFEYIKITLSQGQLIALFILTLLVNIGISLAILFNEYENEDLE